MNYTNWVVVIITFWGTCISKQTIAQQPPELIKKTAVKNKADLIKLEEMLKSVKATPTDKSMKNTKTTSTSPTAKTTSPKIASKYSKSKSNYTIDKKGFESNYNFLTNDEKEKVKHLPPAPDAIRDSHQAKDLFKKLSGFDGLKEVNASTKSMQLMGYYMKYYKLKQKVEYVVQESDKLEADFKKKNPTILFGNNMGKTYTSENSLVYLPLGDASFADEVVAAEYINGNIKFAVENCLGTPNYIEEVNVKNNKGIYSLGLNGSLTVKFTNNALVDVNGPDLFIFEAGEIEPTNLEISKDGSKWINVGSISGGTASVDIKNYIQPNEYFYYVRLTDLATQSTIAGADIDAVAAIGAAMKLSLSAEILFDVGKSNLKPEGINAIKKLAQSVQTIGSAQIIVEGHTDDIGTNEENNNLSLLRAQSVSAILKIEFNNKLNFIYKELGKGETVPEVPNTSDENRKKNRRVEIIVIPQ